MAESSQQEPAAAAPAQGTLGTLFLVGRKTGLNVQGFPIDSQRVTIGRDYDCDIRLYFSDVSKFHAEITFDLLTGQASLHVHGGNGVHFAHDGDDLTVLKPPSVVPLSNGDTLIIRKKMFKFEYPSIDSVESVAPDSPLKTAIPFPSPAKPVRRRASHRLSLVPAGREFVPHSPAKATRRNTLGAAVNKGGSQPFPTMESTTPVAEEDEPEEVVDVVDGDEGDKVYLEAAPAAITQPAENVPGNPFMTMQTEAKSILQAPSMPKARKSISFGVSQAPKPDPQLTPVRPPGPTRSVSAPSLAIPEVTPQLVRLTPKGSPSLRKSLLVRSARKAWEQTRSPGVQGAVDKGLVATRRKSSGLSPKKVSPTKEAKAVVAREPVSLEQEMKTQEAPRVPLQEIQWIAEDGVSNISISDSDSDKDSLEADVSLDIPGQSVFSLNPKALSDEALEGSEAAEEDQPVLSQNVQMDGVEEDESEDDNDDDDDENDDEAEEEDDVDAEEEVEEQVEQINESFEEEEEPVENSYRIIETELSPNDHCDQDVDDSVPDSNFALPGTPAAVSRMRLIPLQLTWRQRQAMSQFYTPQPRRGLGTPHRPLATIGGPATRRTVSGSGNPRAVPGSLGRPQRMVSGGQAPQLMSTPVQSVAVKPLASEVRRSHGRHSPLTMKPHSAATDNPWRLHVLYLLLHPASKLPSENRFLSPSSPHILILPSKFRKSISRMALHPVLPLGTSVVDSDSQPMSTPAPRTTLTSTLSLTTIKPRPGSSAIQFGLPRTPAVAPQPGSTASSRASAASRAGLAQRSARPVSKKKEDASPVVAVGEFGNDSGDVEDVNEAPRSRSSSPSIPPSLSFTGLREMLKPLSSPKTPSFIGMRDLFGPVVATNQATPTYTGMKQMMELPKVAATPSFTGVRKMLTTPLEPPTPKYEGLGAMLEIDEDGYDAFEGEESANESYEAPPPTRGAAATRGRKPAARATRAAKATGTNKAVGPSKGRQGPSSKAAVEDDGNGAPPSPAKSTRSTKSKSSAKSKASGPSSKSGKSTAAKRTVQADSRSTVEIIRSSPTRPETEPVADLTSPTKPKAKSAKSRTAQPLKDLDDQTTDVPVKPTKGTKSKTATAAAPKKAAKGKSVRIEVEEEDKENGGADETAAAQKSQKATMKKARQSTVASRTRSRV
ncbi:hypothetical protein BD324DRAFT_639344 [Kockovaella imperatae]|uniref:FHA domain-containing protein n=1 Tax=Kockovaella imperatae TaxID=4999 RepID=A0A1Y1U6B1_9TREE|nr:hypothetical protein BD324DRAFT_639344 [Kockovaella imperatae]ORX33569.1 hypothetical protein BD324DRAFT_639344 [Kockovaella imperatae]